MDFGEEIERSKAELEAWRSNLTPEEKQAVRKEIITHRRSLLPLIRRNLKIITQLRPRITAIQEELGLRAGMSDEERGTWKTRHSLELRQATEKMLKEYGIPVYQVPFLSWLSYAGDDQVARLEAFVKNPESDPPEGVQLLLGATLSFGSPVSRGWEEETGFRVAVMLLDEGGSLEVLGDLRGLPEGSWRHLLKEAGDFTVRGNLQTLDVEGWRRIGKMLVALKKHTGMGQALGFSPGAPAGKGRRKKGILGDKTWAEIGALVGDNTEERKRIGNEYVDMRVSKYREEYAKLNPGKEPSPEIVKEVQTQARRYFNSRVSKQG